MRSLKIFVLIVVIITISILVLEKVTDDLDKTVDSVEHTLTPKKEFFDKKVPKVSLIMQKYQGEVFQWVGKSTDDLLLAFGEPKRKDLSSYGYTWWVYTNGKTEYLQFGIKDGKIQTLFATGGDISIEPFQIGEKYDKLAKELDFSSEVSYSHGISSYTFLLEKEDLQMRPLVKLSDNLYLQLYFDTFRDSLSSVRVMTGETLLTQRPYGLKYRGALPEAPILTEAEWEKVEEGMEQQVFDITNIFRYSFQKSSLSWEEKVSEVAFLHSKDMAEQNYFSHYSMNGEGLKERLEKKNVYYFAAGENIAAQYVDAAAAVEGWLNSEGHREALLNDEYTHLGVGVYRLFYTQNFLSKPL